MGTTTDTDTKVLSSNPTMTTCLAANLNAYMSRNADARDAYARIYGVSWVALGNGVEINDSASSTAVTAR